MTTPTTQPDMTEPTSPPPKRRRDVIRWLVYGTLGFLLLLAAGIYTAASWLDGESGRAWLLSKLNQSGVVKIERVDGPLWRDVTVTGISVDTPEVAVKVDRVHLVWDAYALWGRTFSARTLDIGNVEIRTKPQPPKPKPSPPPTSLALPLGIQINELRLGKLVVVDTPVELHDIKLAFSSSGRFHVLDLKQLATPHGRLWAKLSLDGQAPFKVGGSVDFAGHADEYAVNANYKLAGNLRDLALNGQISGARMQGRLNLRVDAFAPYVYNIVHEAKLEIDQLNPATVLAGLPQADLSVRLNVQPTGEDTARGTLSVRNAKPLAIQQKGVPVASIDAAFDVRNGRLDLNKLQAQLLGNGKLDGQGQFRADRLDAKLVLAGIDLAKLVPSTAKTQLAGTIALTGPYHAPDVKADLNDPGFKTSLKADFGWINPQKERRIAIRKLDLARGSSSAKLSGEFGLDKQDFRAEGQFAHFNPADFLAAPAGDISGQLKASGGLKPHWQALLDYQFANSRFNGEPLVGKGHAQLADQHLSNVDLFLQLGSNRLTAVGALGKPGDKLALKLALENLAELGHGFGGRVIGNADVSGAFTKPLINGKLGAANVLTPWGLRVARGDALATLYPDLTSPAKIELSLEQAQGFGAEVAKAQFNLDGTQAQHRLRLDVDGNYQHELVSLALAASGGLNAEQQWRGRIDELTLKARLPMRLMGATNLEAGPKAVHLGNARLAIGESTLQIDRLNWQPGKLDTSGSAPRLLPAEWAKLAGLKKLDTDLVLSARWQIAQANWLDGFVELERLSGDAAMRNGDNVLQALQLDQFKLRVAAVQSRVTAAGELQSRRFGNVKLSGDTVVDAPNWRPAPGASLNLLADGNLPDLAKIAPLFGNDIQLAGRAKFHITRNGPFDATARLSGTVDGDDLAIKDSATGVSLNKGLMRIQLKPDQVVLDTVQFSGGTGKLTAQGTLDISGADPVAKATVVAEKLTLINKPDMLLVLSGNGNISYSKDGLSVTGKMKADSGDIYYRAADTPKLSDDVVIVGAEPKEASHGLSLANLQFDVDLGDDFRFRGYGIEAELGGVLRLVAKPNQSLAAFGQVKVLEGSTYRAYGQKLDIERGVLSFAGPLDNPGLDILAMRRGLSVEAGVAVKGTALSPRVTLYSEPTVPDNDKLAWLLFGHGTDSMDKGDSAVLVQLLNAAMTGGDPGTSLTDQVFGAVGIDEVGMATGKMQNGTTTQVVSVSKRLSKTVKLSLEKSMNGLQDGIKLSWQFSRRWSLVSRFGTDESTLDATYTMRFD
ncbi:translocation/assembly module TamB domain-containing protein [Andreprevotia chitinilytica]|uniref:translocation/assembly module TamB domain-containing protein n=1 Tax=Andreprevotia chitinilytica TaxID=396808 RepID=UPI000554F268|nr:translocation/assembly module TamB domain-containing protein [Andreprevotia chitinilytica]